jgi:asparagine synthase (glutamine-hydrolysing)
MFAFGLWDARERILHLARDRFGEKPLYYGSFAGTLLFGSELKALRASSCWAADIDRNALTLLVRHGYIPAPHSVFRQVRKVEPGRIVSVRIQGSHISLSEATYWNPLEAFEAAVRADFVGSAEDAVASIDQALRDAIAHQMVADVPVGAFLSGGIDSSLIVALMQQLSTRPVRTFSIGISTPESVPAQRNSTRGPPINAIRSDCHRASMTRVRACRRLYPLHEARRGIHLPHQLAPCRDPEPCRALSKQRGQVRI